MNLKVRLFAILRQEAGRDSIELELPPGATVGEALDQLALSRSWAGCCRGCRCGWR